MATIGAHYRDLRRRLRDEALETPDLDARLLVCDTFSLDPASLILREEEEVDEDRASLLWERAARRLRGEPVGRILGRRFFFDHEFALSTETLEPRPDTEALVTLAIDVFRLRSKPDLCFADLGTGTGAIAVSLLAQFPQSRCVAIDLAEGALRTAKANAGAADVAERFWPLRADYLSALADGSLDAVVSNPPYIPSEDIETLDKGVREHDPRLALDGGPDGLDAYRAIAEAAARCLSTNGDLLLEIGIGQEKDVRDICAAWGFSLRQVRRDLGGVSRALWFCCDGK